MRPNISQWEETPTGINAPRAGRGLKCRTGIPRCGITFPICSCCIYSAWILAVTVPFAFSVTVTRTI